MKKILIVLSCLLGLLKATNLYAENIRMEEIVVTATRTEIQKAEIPASVTVISEKEIHERGVSTISDILQDVSGLDVTQQGGPGKITSTFIRGAESRHTLVLIDGVRVNSPTLGGFDFSDLTVDNIERIEVIRGPLSTLYGSDALGGVIQIFTKKGKISTGAVSFEGGSYGTSKEAVSAEVKKDLYDLSLTASRTDTHGFSAFKSGSERDGYENTSISLRLGRKMYGGRTDLTTRLIQSKTELDGCKFDPDTFSSYECDNPAYEQERRMAIIGLLYSSQFNPSWEQRLSASVTSEHLINRDIDPNGVNSRIDTTINNINWQHNITSDENSRLSIGYEWQGQNGENMGNFSKAFSNHAIYLQEQKKLGTSAQVLAGVRWDDSAIYESALTYRLGMTYLPVEIVKWYAQYGTGFKGPTLNDLFWAGAGNPDLDPEKSKGWEIGIEEMFSDNLSLSVAYYENFFKDLIQWAPIDPSDPFSLWQPQNIARAESRGIETNMVWNISTLLRLEGNYTYNDTEDKDTHSYLLRRPLNKYALFLHLNPEGRWTVTTNFFHTGKRVESDGTDLPAYSKVDIISRYRISSTTEIYGRIENLFDEEYEETKGYGTAGFSTYGGVRMTF